MITINIIVVVVCIITQVIPGTYVTADSGTGVVHCAPAFGEDDYSVCIAAGIIGKGEGIPNPVDGDGCFTSPVEDFRGAYVKRIWTCKCL